MKKILSLVLTCLLLISCFSVVSSAAVAPTPEVQPLWNNTARITGDFTFDGTEGYSYMRVIGKTGVTMIEGYVAVYKRTNLGWTYVADNSTMVRAQDCFLEIEFTGEVGCEYMAMYVFEVYIGNVGETVTENLTAIC